MYDCGKQVRMNRVLRGDLARCSALAIDHGLSGTTHGVENLSLRIDEAIKGNMDAVILSPGMFRKFAPKVSKSGYMGAIMRLDQTTMWRLEGNLPSKYGKTTAISTISDAVCLGADAVICYMFTCHDDPALEVESVKIAAELCEESRRWGMPVIVEPMIARGQNTADPFDPEVVASNTRIAVEIGADIIKTDWVGSAEGFSRVVDCANGVPVLLAGGPRTGTDIDVVNTISEIIRSGAKGILFGRSVVGSPNPEHLMSAISNLIHERTCLSDTLALFEEPMPVS